MEYFCQLDTLHKCLQCGRTIPASKAGLPVRIACRAYDGPMPETTNLNGQGVELPGVEAMPCVHRGDKLRDMPCQLCGQKHRVEPVYACAVHGECSMRAWGSGKSGHVKGMCLTCRDRVEPIVLATIP